MKRTSELLFVLGLLLIFVVSSFVLVLMGADTYKKVVEDMESNFERRTPTSYIATKIRQGDQNGQVTIQQKEGRIVLVLEQSIEEVAYETWIYEYEGKLYEVFIEKGTVVDLSDGMCMLELYGLKMERLQKNLFRFEAMDSKGNVLESIISLRSE